MTARVVLALWLALALTCPALAEEDLAAAGARASAEFARKVQVEPGGSVRSRAVAAALARLRPVLMAASGPRGDVQDASVSVYTSSEPHAFSYPDGRVFLSSALVDLAGEPDAVSFCVAHELVHSCLGHHERRAAHRKGLPGPDLLVRLLQVPFDHDLEFEADRYALFFCVQSGAGPERILAFADRLQRALPAAATETHPEMAERARVLRGQFHESILPALNNWRRGMRDRSAGDFGPAAMWFGRVEQVLPLAAAVPHNVGCALLEQAWCDSAPDLARPVVLPVPARTLAGRAPKDLVRQARMAFERAGERNPRQVESVQGVALCDYLLADPQRALQALKALPPNAPALTLEGVLRQAAGRPGASELYRKALAQDPSYWPARYNLALLLERSDAAVAAALWTQLASASIPKPWAAHAQARTGLARRSAVLSEERLGVALPGGTLAVGGPAPASVPPDVEVEVHEDGRVKRIVLTAAARLAISSLGPAERRARYVEVLGPPSRTLDDLGSEWLVWDAQGLSVRFLGEEPVERVLF